MTEIIVHFHGGPLAGLHRVTGETDRLEVRVNGHRAVYVRDHDSAGGRCFDFDYSDAFAGAAE